MAKIRGFKPDLWTDEDFVDLSPYARLLWMGLWSYACDNGHVADKSKQIKMRVLPTDDVNCAELLREIAEKDLIRRHDGVITIPNFTKHQKPDKRYFQTCEVPGCARPGADSQPETRGGHHEPTPGARRGPDVVSQGPHVDGDGDGDGEVMVINALPDKSGPKPKPSRATQRPVDFRPSQAHVDLAAELGIDLRTEWQQFCDHHDAKGSTYKDWPAALRTWIRNAPKFRGARTQTPNQPTRVQSHLALAAQLAQETLPQIGERR